MCIFHLLFDVLVTSRKVLSIVSSEKYLLTVPLFFGLLKVIIFKYFIELKFNLLHYVKQSSDFLYDYHSQFINNPSLPTDSKCHFYYIHLSIVFWCFFLSLISLYVLLVGFCISSFMLS